MKLTNNIDVIRIPLNGNKLYYFPKNTNLKGKKINNIYVTGDGIDPYTGKNIQGLYDCFITLIDTKSNTIVDNVDLFYFAKNNATAITINSVIDWEVSYINIQEENQTNSEILLFVEYDNTITAGEFNYSKTKTLFIPANYKGNFERFIDSTYYGKLLKIDIPYYNNVWFSLYDKNGKNFNSCPAVLFQNEENIEGDWKINQAVNNPMLLNYYNVNWQRSEIINNNNNQVELILYFAE